MNTLLRGVTKNRVYLAMETNLTRKNRRYWEKHFHFILLFFKKTDETIHAANLVLCVCVCVCVLQIQRGLVSVGVLEIACGGSDGKAFPNLLRRS